MLKNHVLEGKLYLKHLKFLMNTKKENKMEVKDSIMKKLRLLMIEHVKILKEVYDRE